MQSSKPPSHHVPPIIALQPLAFSLQQQQASQLRLAAYDDAAVLLEPYEYLLQVPGKEVRSLLIDSFNRWLNVDDKVITEIKRIVRMLHTASLMIDDIQDNSKLRRGIPTAHLVYGTAMTINSANYMYFKAQQVCMSMGNPEAQRVFLEEMLRLHWGQGFELHWREHHICPTHDDYRRMVLDKTGGLFRLAVKIMQQFAPSAAARAQDFVPLVNELALYFQIRDDLMNLLSADQLNKSFAEDLTEGKYSFPIIHAILANPADHRLRNILKQRPEDAALKEYAIQYMHKTGSYTYTRSVLRQLEQSISQLIAGLGGNPELSRILSTLAQAVADPPPSPRSARSQQPQQQQQQQQAPQPQHPQQTQAPVQPVPARGPSPAVAAAAPVPVPALSVAPPPAPAPAQGQAESGGLISPNSLITPRRRFAALLLSQEDPPAEDPNPSTGPM